MVEVHEPNDPLSVAGYVTKRQCQIKFKYLRQAGTERKEGSNKGVMTQYDDVTGGGTLTRHHVASEQDPDGGDERAEHHHEADEQPQTSSCRDRFMNRQMNPPAASSPSDCFTQRSETETLNPY